jgi:hypothetical protein
MASVPCSPCGYERMRDCPNEHLCMHLITPEQVFRHASEMMGQPALVSSK